MDLIDDLQDWIRVYTAYFSYPQFDLNFFKHLNTNYMKAKMALISDSNSDYERGQEYAISSVSVYVDGIRKF